MRKQFLEKNIEAPRTELALAVYIVQSIKFSMIPSLIEHFKMDRIGFPTVWYLEKFHMAQFGWSLAIGENFLKNCVKGKD